MKCVFCRLLPAFPSFALVLPCLATPKTGVFTREVGFEVVNTPFQTSPALLSPNGGWLAYAQKRPEAKRCVVFTDFQNARSRVIAGEPSSWSADSRVCAFSFGATPMGRQIGQRSGWELVWPASGRKRVILLASSAQSLVEFAPKTRRLALVQGFGNNRLRFWNGRKLSRGFDWGRVLQFPDWYRDEVSPSALTWSTDERALALRFYGHAERMPGSAQHTAVFTFRGRHLRWLWSGETGELKWLDSSRLMFKGDDEGLGGPVDLEVADVRARGKRRRSRVWLSQVVAWTLSARRDFVCALRANGDLLRSSTRRKRWQLLRRGIKQDKGESGFAPVMQVSPRADMVALWNPEGGRGIALFSTSSRRPWTISWRAPRTGASVVGWRQGQSLPLIEMQDKSFLLVQLSKSKK